MSEDTLRKYMFWRRQYCARSPQVRAVFASKEQFLSETTNEGERSWFEKTWEETIEGVEAEYLDATLLPGGPWIACDVQPFPWANVQRLRHEGWDVCPIIPADEIVDTFTRSGDYIGLDDNLLSDGPPRLQAAAMRLCGLTLFSSKVKGGSFQIEISAHPEKDPSVTGLAVQLLLEQAQNEGQPLDISSIYADPRLHEVMSARLLEKAKFRPGRGESSRALGLLVWDRIHLSSLAKSPEEVVRIIDAQQPGMWQKLNLSGDGRRVRNLYSYTCKCIESGEVLSMT